MPATLPPIDAALFDRFKKGDEQALEQIFRLFASGMAAAALEDVGHAAGATRAIEQVMVRAWSHRAQFPDAATMPKLIADELHEAGQREKGRRAALRRFEQHEGGGGGGNHAASATVNTNEVWARIQKDLHPDTAASAKAKQAHAEATRHEAAAHIAGVGRKGLPVMARIGIAAVAIAAFGGILVVLQKASAGTRVARALASKEAVATSTKAGQRGSMKLAEGSNAELGGDATVTIPKLFPKEMRAVKIDGTARFSVAPGLGEPFEVRAGNAAIVSTTGSFTVAAYPNEPVIVRADTGSLTVRTDTATRTLNAGQAARVDSSGAIADPTAGELAQATSWTAGRFTVNNRTIKDVLPMLKRWYSVDVRADLPLLPRQVSMEAALGSTDSVITALEAAAKVKQVYIKGAMILQDDPNGEAAKASAARIAAAAKKAASPPKKGRK
ncbi:MAG: FecR domain-containing protein [Gemmatimonadetes bacterium]|nr:FecR domain-containing protein [Gemmatimonadota bacterium]